jgi:DUF1016 N-terminal domain/YhcG PDDEXK nuclease domain
MGAGRQRGTGDGLMKGWPDEGLRPLLRSLRELIEQARQQVLRAVDTVQVQTCWEIGRHIVEFEQGGVEQAAYGKRLLPALAEVLTAKFGRGFDATNLRHMRGFLVFYNYLLKCFVLFALILGELTHQDIGQMDMYVRISGRVETRAGWQPLSWHHSLYVQGCSVVRYSVLHEKEQLFASKYKLVLPSEE